MEPEITTHYDGLVECMFDPDEHVYSIREWIEHSGWAQWSGWSKVNGVTSSLLSEKPWLPAWAVKVGAEAATPGPWFLRTNRHRATSGRNWGWLDYQRQSASHPPGLNVTWEDGSKSRDNAQFVAAARTAVPALLDALEAAEAREKKLRGALTTIKTASGNVVWNAGRGVRAAGPGYDRCWEHVASIATAVLAETAP